MQHHYFAFGVSYFSEIATKIAAINIVGMGTKNLLNENTNSMTRQFAKIVSVFLKVNISG